MLGGLLSYAPGGQVIRCEHSWRSEGRLGLTANEPKGCAHTLINRSSSMDRPKKTWAFIEHYGRRVADQSSTNWRSVSLLASLEA